MKYRFIILPLLLLVWWFQSSCARSAAFHRDQVYSQEELPYYSDIRSPGRTTPSERIDRMGQPKRRAIVLEFWNDTPVRDVMIGKFSAEELKRELMISNRVIISDDIQSDLGTQDLVDGSNVKVSQLVREGRKLGAGILIIGRVARIVFRQKGDDIGLFRNVQSLAAADVEIKVYDITVGREILSTGRVGESSSNAMVAMESDRMMDAEYRSELARLAVRDAIALLAPEVTRATEKLSWEGQVAKITGNKIYINAGRASGVLMGDILKVMTPGDEIHDPASGAFIGRTPGQVKGTVEVIDFVGPDAAVAEIHSGAAFQEGDSVKLY